jgi:hypothetical protein
MEILEEMDNISTYIQSTKIAPRNVNNFKIAVGRNKIEAIIKIIPSNKSSGLENFTIKF